MDSLVCAQITPTRSKATSQSLHVTPSTRSIPIYVQRSPRTPAEQSGSRCKKWSVLCASSSQAEHTASTSNPFDVDPEQLTLPSCSPSMFSSFFSSQNKESTSSKKSFRWSIEQMSHFWPADIDEESVQFFCSRNDEEYEIRSQRAIEKYFSQQDIVPSPWVANENVPLPSPAVQSSSSKTANRTLNDRRNRKRTVWSQTLLTIPPSVDVESVLGRYLTFDCDQREQGHESPPVTERSGSFRDSFGTSLRRKLFCNGVDESPATSGGTVDSPGTDASSRSAEECVRSPLAETPASLNLCSSPIPPLRASSQGTTPIGEPMQLSPICRSDRKTPADNKLRDRNGSARRASVVSPLPKPRPSDDEGPTNEPEKCVSTVPEECIRTTQEGSSREDFDMSVKDYPSDSSEHSSIDSQCGATGATGRRSFEMDTGYQTYNSNGKLDSLNLRLPSVGSGMWGSLVASQQTDDV